MRRRHYVGAALLAGSVACGFFSPFDEFRFVPTVDAGASDVADALGPFDASADAGAPPAPQGGVTTEDGGRDLPDAVAPTAGGWCDRNGAGFLLCRDFDADDTLPSGWTKLKEDGGTGTVVPATSGRVFRSSVATAGDAFVYEDGVAPAARAALTFKIREGDLLGCWRANLAYVNLESTAIYLQAVRDAYYPNALQYYAWLCLRDAGGCQQFKAIARSTADQQWHPVELVLGSSVARLTLDEKFGDGWPSSSIPAPGTKLQAGIGVRTASGACEWFFDEVRIDVR